MTISFIIRQLDHVETITEATGTIPAYGIINRVLIDMYEHDQLLAMGQGLISKQRRVLKYIHAMFDHVLVPNKFISKDYYWANADYTIVNESDVAEITEFTRDLLAG